MAEFESDGDTEFEGRLRRSLAVMAPPANGDGVLERIQYRAQRRRRRIREGIGAGLVVVVGGGTLAGFALTSNPQMATPPPVQAMTVPSSTAPAGVSSVGATEAPTAAGSAARPAPSPPPCPVAQTVPSMESGRFCGPTPRAGNGLGPDGQCTGRETAPPCGAGVVAGRFYAYTVSGSCGGLMVFDGRQWVAELTPPHSMSPFPAWIQLSAGGQARWIGPNGSVGLQPYTGQDSLACG